MSEKPIPVPALSTQVGGNHYKGYAIQPIEYCMANHLNACESAIVKYITRWKEKGGVQDLEKIKHYVDLLITLDPQAQHLKFLQEQQQERQRNPGLTDPE